MTKYILLLKMQLYDFFGINRIIHSKDKREKQRSLVMFFGIAVVIGMLMVYATLYCVGMAKIGLTEAIPMLAVLISVAITLILTFMKSTGVLIGLRDYDMVMSLPVSSAAVVTSRITMVYLMSIAISLVASVPPIIVYTIYANPSFSVVIMLLLSVVLLPIIPMIVALSVGTLINAISLRFRHRNIITLVLSIAALLGVLGLSMQSGKLDDIDMANLGKAVNDAVSNIYPPSILIQRAITENHLQSLCLFALLTLVCAALFIAIVSIFYKSLNTAAFSHAVKHGYKMGGLKQSTPFMAMYKREFARYFSCPIYVVNSSVGVIMLLAAAIVLQFVKVVPLLEEYGLGMLLSAAPMMLALFVTLTCTTASSLSLEGKSRFIMCSVPVKLIEIFKSKIAVSLTVILPITFISTIIIGFALKPAPLDMLLMFIVPTAYAFFVSVFGMFINVKLPKYDWPSEYYAVKNSMSVTVAALGGLACGVVPLMLCLALPDMAMVIMVVTSAVVILAATLMYGRLKAYRLYM